MQNVLLFMMVSTIICLDVYEQGNKKETINIIIKFLILNIFVIVSYLLGN